LLPVPPHPTLLFLFPTLQLLEEHRGQDISEVFAGGGSVGHAHSKGARALLENYCIGRLEGHEHEGRGDELAALVDESKPLLPQVRALCGAGCGFHGEGCGW